MAWSVQPGFYKGLDSQTLKTNLPKWTVGRGMNWRFGIGICTLRYVEWLANGDLPYNTGNSAQYSVIICVWKESKKKGCVYIYNWITSLCSRIYHNTVNQLYFNKTFKNKKRLKGNSEHLFASNVCTVLLITIYSAAKTLVDFSVIPGRVWKQGQLFAMCHVFLYGLKID